MSLNYFDKKGSIGYYKGATVYMYPGEYEKYKDKVKDGIIVVDYEGTMVKNGYVIGIMKSNGNVVDMEGKVFYSRKDKEERKVEEFSFSNYSKTVDKFFEELKALDNC